MLLLEDEAWAIASLCVGPIQGVPHPHPHFSVRGCSRRAVLGPPPGQDRSPLPALQRAPPFQIETDEEKVAGCLEVAAG